MFLRAISMHIESTRMNPFCIGAVLGVFLVCSVSAQPGIAVSDATVGENGARVSFMISLSQSHHETITVWYRTLEVPASLNVPYPAASGVDFLPADSSVAFAPGETSKTVSVEIIDDEVNEAVEPF